MTEPKRYSPDIPMDWDLHFKESGTGMILRADDPAIVSALKDSEDWKKFHELLPGIHSINDILSWKRSHEAMEKLEKGNWILSQNTKKHWVIEVYDNDDNYLFTKSAPSLISAIEQMKE